MIALCLSQMLKVTCELTCVLLSTEGLDMWAAGRSGQEHEEVWADCHMKVLTKVEM